MYLSHTHARQQTHLGNGISFATLKAIYNDAMEDFELQREQVFEAHIL